MKESTTEASLEEIIPSKEHVSNPIISLNSDNPENTESDEEIQIEQEKVKMDLLNLDVSLTNAADVLRTMNISDKDNYQLIKFKIRVRAVYTYKWEVLHIPSDIKKFFKQMDEEVRRKELRQERSRCR